MRTLDDLARGAAARARADAEVLAGPRDERSLDDVSVDSSTARRGRALAGAAAVVIVVAVVAVVWSRSDDDRTIVDTPVGTPMVTTPTTAPTTTATTAPAATITVAVEPTTTVAGEPTSTSIALLAGDVSPGGAVSHLAPPPDARLTVLGEVPLVSDLTIAPPAVAVLLDGRTVVVDNARRVLVVVTADGTTRDVPFGESLGGLIEVVAGADGLLYGIEPGEMGRGRFVALPLDGIEGGAVVASVDIDLTADYIEAPPGGVLRAGPTGIVNARTGDALLTYPNGAAYPVSVYEAHRDDAGGVHDTVRRVDGSIVWAFEVERIATSINDYTGDAPPATTADGGARSWTAIGPYDDEGDSDYPASSLPVLAFLAADGTVTWTSIPDGWQLASSGIGGTVLIQRDAERITLASPSPSPSPIDD